MQVSLPYILYILGEGMGVWQVFFMQPSQDTLYRIHYTRSIKDAQNISQELGVSSLTTSIVLTP